MNNTKHVIVNIISIIVLVVIIVVETMVLFKLLYKRDIGSIDVFTQAAINAGKTQISIDEITTYPDVPFDCEDGEVMAIDNKKEIRVKISGQLNENNYDNYGYYYYTNPDGVQETIKVDENTDRIEELRKYITEYWHGQQQNLVEFAAIGSDMSSMTFYQGKKSTAIYPVIYNQVAKQYYMILDNDKSYYIISSADPCILTDDKVTAHFGNPSDDPQIRHNYSQYEELAAENTIRELQDKGDKKGSKVNNPYTSTDISGSHSTYTAEEDNTTREQMLNLGNYKWKADGTANGTQITINTTTAEAKQSQWDITATTYSYDVNDLRISMLSAQRTNDTFTISGNINNTLNHERPYVMLIKFLDSEGNLLGIRLLDNRANMIPASGVSNFKAIVKSTDMDIAKITSVQFEVY